MNAARLLLCALLTLAATAAVAEQKVVVGDYEIHYIVIPTTFLKPAIASSYGLVRGDDRSLVNVSVLRQGTPVRAGLSGSAQNLLGQITTLEFREVREGDAVYYLAVFRHGNEEVHRFALAVELPDGGTSSIEFQQKLYWRH